MKITIENNDFSQTRGCFVFCNGKKIQNKQGGMFPNDFDENDILDLLGEKRFAQYSKGKFEFSLTKKEIFAATEDMNSILQLNNKIRGATVTHIFFNLNKTKTMEHIIYTGAEDTMRAIAERAYIKCLNSKTMKYQKVYGEMQAVKDETMEISWKVICNSDLRTIAKERGLTL